jgi:hypothetical protein
MHLRPSFNPQLCPLAWRIIPKCALLIFVALISSVAAQASPPERPTETHILVVSVVDENGVAVPAARVRLDGPGGTLRCETDLAGHCQFTISSSGAWQLHAEKEGFYALSLPAIQPLGSLEISLHHQEEIRESVNVVESVPAIDPAQVSSQEQLSGIDILNIPYPNTRDYRYALNFVPGVVLDQNAQPHVAGAETYETLVLLDGFNVTQPANGQLLVRPSTDALRKVSVETSRISAEYGKGPAGVLSLETGIGDDHYRFAATNFVPSFQNKRGWALDKVDPRFTFSGPIQKGKIWFFDGLDGEYDNVIIPQLLPGADDDKIWRGGNLAKVQANVTSRDIVTGSFLVNWLHDDHLGFSIFAPPATRPSDSENVYVASLKEQHTFSGERLLEFGFAFDQYGLRQSPSGAQPYVLTPDGAEGSYYLRSSTAARRSQALANLYIPRQWHGRHDLIFGADIDHLAYDQLFRRRPITALRENGTVAVQSVFFNSAPSSTFNTEGSAYIQDRWSLMPRLLLEPGIRFDWDEIVRQPVFSPRLAGTYVLDNSGDTKISAGIGITYQASNLSLIAAPLAGARQDTFYNAPAPSSTFLTTFTVDRNTLRVPRYINWSVALERKLPGQIFLKTEFLRRRSEDSFVYNTPGGAAGTDFLLQNNRRDRYDSFKVDLRRSFRPRYVVTASYTRSSSTSNQVLDYSLDNLLISPQVPGPYPWDAPNRFISWGLLPLIKGFDTAYSLEARTGFPFPILNQQQQLVLPPGAYRFPPYFTLNLHIEKRFQALGFYWALRGGFDNLTNRQNAYAVNNILGSPQFLRFSSFDRRAFTARIRFLGRK